ncbi:LOW QUALITY PROTEIN: hypothetical protein MAR_026928 [Mya arenaria]|uniref:C2H2-type domain-containing protein n=1 Tax=Mya arenaria TaxID=6604 RepID=A0ABY7ES05_MYAAR|nr:LOW QUALITY PROTEIN: hypothetical protein MAR_026928 [Mya arenaria]
MSTDRSSNINETMREEENQLVNFFSRNRLETEYVQKFRPVVRYASLLNGLTCTVTEGPLLRESENNNDATNDKMSDSDVDSFYGLEGGSQNSGIDSEDNASTCSDSLLGRCDGNELISKPSQSSDSRCINSNAIQTYTKTVKLRDVHLKLNIIDVAGGQRVIKCPDCDFITTSIDMYVPHLRDHMRNKNACFLCGKLFSRSWLLKEVSEGIRRQVQPAFPPPHTLGEGEESPRCGRFFAQKRYLHKHNLEVCRVGLDSPASTSSGSATPTATSTSFGPATPSTAAATSSRTTESQGTCTLICSDV